MIVIISGFIGALTRRWWGGWLNPAHLVKLLVVFILATLISFLSGFGWYSIANGSIILLAFMNTFHGEGMNMGRTSTASFWACVGIMGGSYSFYTTLVGISCSIASSNWLCMAIAPLGFISPFAYELAWRVFKPSMRKVMFPSGVMFIDGPTALGEFALGALLFSSVPIAKLLIGG